MDAKSKALKVFRTLIDFENEVEGNEEEKGWTEPRFDVRLDASSEGSRADEDYGQVIRTWRIRLTFSGSAWADRSNADALRDVLAIADEAGAGVNLQNAGIEMTWRDG